MKYLGNMRTAMRASVAAELLDLMLDRGEANFGRFKSPENWMTLEPPPDMNHWAAFLQNEMHIEDFAIEAFVELVEGGRMGYQEGNRILFHLMKDSSSGPWKKGNPSSWLYTVCHEALDAIRNWQDWDCEYLKSIGKPVMGKGEASSGKGTSSTSSDPWASYKGYHGSSSSSSKGGPRGYRG